MAFRQAGIRKQENYKHNKNKSQCASKYNRGMNYRVSQKKSTINNNNNNNINNVNNDYKN